MTTLFCRTDSTTWKDVVSDLSLVVGETYTIQNVSSDIILMAEKSTTPSNDGPYHRILPSAFQSITPDTGLGIWIRGFISGITLAVTESS